MLEIDPDKRIDIKSLDADFKYFQDMNKYQIKTELPRHKEDSKDGKDSKDSKDNKKVAKVEKKHGTKKSEHKVMTLLLYFVSLLLLLFPNSC
jgi:hypothetical protein